MSNEFDLESIAREAMSRLDESDGSVVGIPLLDGTASLMEVTSRPRALPTEEQMDAMASVVASRLEGEDLEFHLGHRAEAASLPFNAVPLPHIEFRTSFDEIQKSSHYNQGKFEAIDVIEDWKLGFHLGNVVKYISRCEFKASKLKDLKKARYYLDRYIQKLEQK